jgi:alkanesulfonate monooxygenase SsuD/methylene tetrahydromethanopterin reductase-like flavin-dependent oxidoreductase (luciferase family)
MDIGIGLPTAIPGIGAADLLRWASEAEAAGFSTLGTVDRVAYPNLEPLTALAAVAVSTSTIRLTTSALISPVRSNPALLAKQIGTVDLLSGGRLVLGLTVGQRDADYTASAVAKAGRGAVLETQLAALRHAWSGQDPPIGPGPSRPSGPPVLLSGHSAIALERAARLADGWIAGSGGPPGFAQGAAEVRRQWQQRGRTGAPRLLALAYYCLGADAEEVAGSYLRDYYASAGPHAEMVVRGAGTSVAKLRGVIGRYADAGCDELILMPCSDEPDQVALLAEAVSLVPNGDRVPAG